MPKLSRPIYTFDIETDPFQYERLPRAFACSLYDGAECVTFWGADCCDAMRDYLETIPPGIIYVHNGGRFDIYHVMRWIIGHPMRVINRRIVEAEIECRHGTHRIRDSWAIMPLKLKTLTKGGDHEKLDIEWWKLEADNREEYAAEIIEYLEMDVISLWDRVTAFLERYGDYLTVGSMAMSELRARHEFEQLTKTVNDELRSTYYHGARVECIEKGYIKDGLKIYDVNSMYPHVMKEFFHPVGCLIMYGNKVTENTRFLKVRGKVTGHVLPFLPYAYNPEADSWAITIHEFKAAEELKLFRCTKVMETVDMYEETRFDTFVNDFYAERLRYKAAGDRVGETNAKFPLNAAYGKFAQDSAKYSDWLITDGTYNCGAGGWTPSVAYKGDDQSIQYTMWERPSHRLTVYNAAVGASVTGAARSVLLRALATCDRPVYCDTDSIACRALPPGAVMDSKTLGGWKLEAEADEACIGGKKLYAFFNNGVRVKSANKGVSDVTDEEFRRIANGHIVTKKNKAPTYKMDGTVTWQLRKIKRT